MKKFVKYGSFWAKISGDEPATNTTLISEIGMKLPNMDITGLSIVEANDWEDLDWTDTDILCSDFETGWLNPAGEFFGCAYNNHLNQAILVHKKSEAELEKLGFIKITYSSLSSSTLSAYFFGDWTTGDVVPTDAQINYLKTRTRVQNVVDIERKKIMGEYNLTHKNKHYDLEF